jgi:hypothetical protein
MQSLVGSKRFDNDDKSLFYFFLRFLYSCLGLVLFDFILDIAIPIKPLPC